MSKQRNPPLDPDESAAFREAVGEVIPIAHDRVSSRPAPPPAIARQRQLDEARVMQDALSDDFHPIELETGEELIFARSGLQHSVLRKLRRGQFCVGAELDLHGMTAPIARQHVAHFLNDARHAGIRCVRIIHGKGRGSSNKGPVLKVKLNTWLRQRHDVLAYCSARPQDGGTGAAYVLLKR
ncbi:MAG: Smr/MutS family protein [Gammaproteobacteria bacterium]|nr:Smr/MutS family protein [Gammaproteobacteria bacterium]MCP5137294.1 Smr/MutS family protein [Gammaproteobacteria bacterium]